MRTILAALTLVVSTVPMSAAVRLTGRITNENNAPVAGAHITVTGPAKAEAVTDAAGVFTLDLPQEGDYALQVERLGFFRIENRPIVLTDGLNEIQATLTPVREMLESIEVTAEPSPIDLDRPANEQRLSSNELMSVPYPNTGNARSAMRIVPGIIQDNRGALHLNGSTEDQVEFTLDGFQVNDPITGRFDTRIAPEALQSMEVSSGALSADQGRGSAGTIAMISRPGDDRIRYTATNFVPGLEVRKGLTIGGWTPRLGLSGPIRRGRAWFSDTISVSYINHIVDELPKGDDRTPSWRLTNYLTTQVNLTPSNILYTGFLASFWTAPRMGLSALDPWETTVDRRTRQWFYHVKNQKYFTRGAVVEFGYGANRTFAREIPQGSDLLRLMAFGRRGNHFIDAARSASRDQVMANVVFPSFQAAGSHQFRAGIDLDRVGYEQDVRRTGYENYRWDNSLVQRVLYHGSGYVNQYNYQTALYVQDSWRPRPNVMVDAGLRSDWDRVVGRWTAAPRAGLAWRPSRWENTKLTAGWGMVRDATNLRVFARPLDQYSTVTQFAPDGGEMRSDAVSLFAVLDRSLRSPFYRTWNAGVDQTFGSRVSAKVSYVGRRGRRGFTYTNALGPSGGEPPPEILEQFGPQLFDAVYQLGNLRRDVYDAVEVAVRVNLAKQYFWMGSYTRSRALSNGVIDYSLDEPVTVDNNYGHLGWDAPNRLVSWGYLPTPFQNWAVAYLLETRDGFPFSQVNDEGQVKGQVNSLRYPAYFELNLHLERQFVMNKNRWAVRFGFNNITNHDNYTAVNNNIDSPLYRFFYGSQGRSFNVRLRWLGKL